MQSEKANEVQFLSKTVSWDVDHQFLKTGARHGEWVKNLSLHFSSPLHRICSSGGMVYTVDLKSIAFGIVGSSPTWSTETKQSLTD